MSLLWYSKFKQSEMKNEPTLNEFCEHQESQGHSRSQTESSYKGFGMFMIGVAIFGIICLIFNI